MDIANGHGKWTWQMDMDMDMGRPRGGEACVGVKRLQRCSNGAVTVQ